METDSTVKVRPVACCDMGRVEVTSGHIDGSVTKFWPTKAAACIAATSIGWPKNSAWRAHTRFQAVWALKHTHGGMLERIDFAQFRADRERSIVAVQAG